MSTGTTPSDRIVREVTAWEGVSAGMGRRGELAFKVGNREIGHLHGDRAAHFFFGRELFDELANAGRITEHPVFPGKRGPAARRIETEADIAEVIALMRLNYEEVSRRKSADENTL